MRSLTSSRTRAKAKVTPWRRSSLMAFKSVSQAVVDWFQSAANQALLAKLKQLGVWPQAVTRAARVVEGPFAGRTFVITGTLPTWSRDDAKLARSPVARR